MSNSDSPLPADDIRLTKPECIANFLRKNGQFVLYRPIQNNGKLLKLPFAPLDPHGPSIDPLNPSYWASFATVVPIYGQLDQTQFGLGVVLTPALNVTCFDLDNRDDPAAYESAVQAMSVPAHTTWGEMSVSGKGRHYFYIGNPPDGTASMNDVHPNIEIYCNKRFIALTGRVLPGALPDLTDGGGIVAHTFSLRAERRGERIASAGPTALSGVTFDLGRGLMSNERALELLADHRPEIYGLLWHAAPQGAGSLRLMQAIGDLDKIVADPEQIYQIIESTPLGQSRIGGLYRKFHKYWLPDARKSNKQGIWNRTKAEQVYLAANGAQIMATCRYDGEGKLMDGCAPSPEQDFDDSILDDAAVQYDQHSKIGLGRYILDELDPESRVDTPPAIKYLASICKRGMHTPQSDFALFATIATFSAICSMAYRAEDDVTTGGFWLLVAKSGAGKDEALNFWRDALRPTGFKYFIDEPIASAQELYFSGRENRVLVHHRVDAGGDIAAFAPSSKERGAKMLRDALNTAYDASKFGIHPRGRPRSLEGRKEGENLPYTGARVSLIYGCTPAAYDEVFTPEAIGTGIGSRLITLHLSGVKGRYDETGPKPTKLGPDCVLKMVQPIVERTDNLVALYSARDIADAEAKKDRGNMLLKEMQTSPASLWTAICHQTTRVFRMEPTRLDIISAPMPTDEALCADIIIIPEGRFLAASHMKAGPYAIDPSKPLPSPIPPVTYDQAQAEASALPGRAIIPPLPPEALADGATHADAAVSSAPTPVARGELKAEDPEDIERLFQVIRRRHGYR